MKKKSVIITLNIIVGINIGTVVLNASELGEAKSNSFFMHKVQPMKGVTIEQKNMLIPKAPHQPTFQEEIRNDKTAEIIKYIRGNELDVKKLNEYKNLPRIVQNLKNSIQLCLDYWLLDGSKEKKSKHIILCYKKL